MVVFQGYPTDSIFCTDPKVSNGKSKVRKYLETNHTEGKFREKIEKVSTCLPYFIQPGDH